MSIVTEKLQRAVEAAERIAPGSTSWFNTSRLSLSQKWRKLQGIIGGHATGDITPRATARTESPQAVLASLNAGIDHLSEHDTRDLSEILNSVLALVKNPEPAGRVRPVPTVPTVPARPAPAGEMLPTPTPGQKMVSIDAATAVKLLASHDPVSQARAVSYYRSHSEEFLDALAEAQAQVKEQGPLALQRQREAEAIAARRKQLGW